MRDKFDLTDAEEIGPEELVMRAFSRCKNYPKEREGVLGLAQGLRAAADKFSVSMADVIEECVRASSYCPTDYDLLEIARSLRPQAVPEKPCADCEGTGYRHFEREVDDCVMARKVTVSAVKYCACSKGQRLSAKVQERKAVAS